MERGAVDRGAGRRAWLLRTLRWHAIPFALGIGGLTVANFLTGAPWWAFWPTLVWGMIFAVHFMVVKALTVDERWVDERAGELREKSYDFHHIEDITRRIAKRDFSVEPPVDHEHEARRGGEERPREDR